MKMSSSFESSCTQSTSPLQPYRHGTLHSTVKSATETASIGNRRGAVNSATAADALRCANASQLKQRMTLARVSDVQDCWDASVLTSGFM